MPFTYTYTARDKQNPDKVVTFTIFDDYLKVNLTGLIDRVSDLVEEGEEDSPKKAIKSLVTTQTGSALYKAVERLSGPVQINDVMPAFEEGTFKLTFWKRLAGLRFAPITLSISNVDNPDSAAQFVDTLLERQKQAADPSAFAGPLDYWGTWIGLLIGLIVLIKWPKKDNSG